MSFGKKVRCPYPIIRIPPALTFDCKASHNFMALRTDARLVSLTDLEIARQSCERPAVDAILGGIMNTARSDEEAIV